MPRLTATAAERAQATDRFVADWTGRGQEDQDTHTFWLTFLQDVMGISRAHHVINFEKRVRIGRSTKRIDAYIADSRVLIEQKSHTIDLNLPQRQSDGAELTPYQQALRYAQNLPPSETPLFIIVSNFKSFHLYDREHDPQGQNPIIIDLAELPTQLPAFRFITEPIEGEIARQEQANLEAARLIGDIYNAIKHQYELVNHAQPPTTATNSTTPTATNNPDTTTPCNQHDLAVLMVRILFCLYAEDSGLFDQQLFFDYLREFPTGQGAFRDALQRLFTTLNTPIPDRDPYLANTTLARFPYVNGGLFADSINIPVFNADIKHKLLHDGSAGFNWSHISPVIFGSIFESILSGDERRAGGMHYTSVDNIHKVIDPLFLDDLRAQLNAAGNRSSALSALQEKIAELKFLDPACGSGNFLTQTYLELRAIENEILKRLVGENMAFDFGFPPVTPRAGAGSLHPDSHPRHPELDSGSRPSENDVEEYVHSLVKVNVGQFYGIEINDFAVSVANAALWIADHQANQETAKIFHRTYVNLPLQDYQHIVVGNALRMDWNEVLPASECNYIMGNPPFLGANNQSTEQKTELLHVFDGERHAALIDYVACWFKIAAEYSQGADTAIAFVSTNSICQGEQVSNVWKPLFKLGVQIEFAHTTFRWSTEALNSASVFCIIVGFKINKPSSRTLYQYETPDSSPVETMVSNINAYLIDAPNIFINRISNPLSPVPRMTKGCQPTDGGHLIIEDDELREFLVNEPYAEKFIKRLIGAKEFIQSRPRYCLWLVDASPAELRQMPYVMSRIEAVRDFRLNSSQAGTRKLAERPTTFRETYNPETCIIVPMTSSERRQYLPIGLIDNRTISTNLNLIIQNGTIYHFGVLTSQFHNIWMRVVAGRLKSDYRYSAGVVYNNFVWPEPTDVQKTKIEELAQAVLDARDNYPDSSLADLYDPLTMPPDLLRVHQALDKAVEQAYGVNFRGDETKIVSHLFNLYSQAMENFINAKNKQ